MILIPYCLWEEVDTLGDVAWWMYVWSWEKIKADTGMLATYPFSLPNGYQMPNDVSVMIYCRHEIAELLAKQVSC